MLSLFSFIPTRNTIDELLKSIFSPIFNLFFKKVIVFIVLKIPKTLITQGFEQNYIFFIVNDKLIKLIKNNLFYKSLLSLKKQINPYKTRLISVIFAFENSFFLSEIKEINCKI